jgi:hypothetical protein
MWQFGSAPRGVWKQVVFLQPGMSKGVLSTGKKMKKQKNGYRV